MRDGGSWNSGEAPEQNRESNRRRRRDGEEEEREREHVGRRAGSDAGWGVLISSQLFIPVSLHRGERERRKREGERDAEKGGREGERESAATAASMHRCSAPC